MKAPDFWRYGPTSMLANLLSPLGALYGAATAARIRLARPWRCPVPVICVGNLSAGGAGKTPVVLDLAARLQDTGATVHTLSRGYGGVEKGPLRVDRDGHGARRVGDEPLLLSRVAPTWVSADRVAGCKQAADAGADVILMDDGFQDPSCHKDLSLVVVDGHYGFGNGRLIPAGPLRETLARGLARADAFVIIGDDRTGVKDCLAERGAILSARLRPTGEQADLTGRTVLAFAGIGNPDKFYETVQSCGAHLAGTASFPDHHPYSRADLEKLTRSARGLDASLITTTKDRVRIPPDHRDAIDVLSVSVQWDRVDDITNLLKPVVAHVI